MKIKILIIAVLFGWVGQSCTGWIDLEPENGVSYTNYFKSEEDIANLVRGVHLRIQVCEKYMTHQEVLGFVCDSLTNSTHAGIRRMELAQFGTANWMNHYQIIHYGNFILDNQYRMENITSERQEFYCQQAYFALGFAYFRLAQLWGEAPIIKSSLDIGLHAKASTNELLAEAEKWALKALELPEFKDLVDESGKPVDNKQWASKGSAAALLAHLYAWRGYINDSEEDWAECEKYCTKLLTHEIGNYRLEGDIPTLRKALGNNTQLSDETIWELSYKAEEDNSHLAFNFNQYAVFSYYGPLHNITMAAANFTMLIKEETIISDKLYLEDDPRLDFFYSRVPSTGVFKDKNIYFLDKWDAASWIKPPAEANGTPTFVGKDVNRVIWRLADIYLLRAEARLRQDNGPGAISDLNAVRLRAGIDDYSEGNEGEIGDGVNVDLNYAIFRERKRELIFEGQHYFDIVRFGLWGTELTSAYAQLSDQDVANGALYMPVPAGAFTNNPVMTQNPYWYARN